MSTGLSNYPNYIPEFKCNLKVLSYDVTKYIIVPTPPDPTQLNVRQIFRDFNLNLTDNSTIYLLFSGTNNDQSSNISANDDLVKDLYMLSTTLLVPRNLRGNNQIYQSLVSTLDELRLPLMFSADSINFNWVGNHNETTNVYNLGTNTNQFMAQPTSANGMGILDPLSSELFYSFVSFKYINIDQFNIQEVQNLLSLRGNTHQNITVQVSPVYSFAYGNFLTNVVPVPPVAHNLLSATHGDTALGDPLVQSHIVAYEDSTGVWTNKPLVGLNAVTINHQPNAVEISAPENTWTGIAYNYDVAFSLPGDGELTADSTTVRLSKNNAGGGVLTLPSIELGDAIAIYNQEDHNECFVGRIPKTATISDFPTYIEISNFPNTIPTILGGVERILVHFQKSGYRSLPELEGVTITNPLENQVLAVNGTGEWVNASIPGASGTLQDSLLTDVITNPATTNLDGQALRYESSLIPPKWENSYYSEEHFNFICGAISVADPAVQTFNVDNVIPSLVSEIRISDTDGNNSLISTELFTNGVASGKYEKIYIQEGENRGARIYYTLLGTTVSSLGGVISITGITVRTGTLSNFATNNHYQIGFVALTETGANVGGGAGLFRDKTSNFLNFKTITSTGLNITENADTVDISYTTPVSSRVGHKYNWGDSATPSTGQIYHDGTNIYFSATDVDGNDLTTFISNLAVQDQTILKWYQSVDSNKFFYGKVNVGDGLTFTAGSPGYFSGTFTAVVNGAPVLNDEGWLIVQPVEHVTLGEINDVVFTNVQENDVVMRVGSEWVNRQGPIVKNNYSATTFPVNTNDSSEGYSVGSQWIDTATDRYYMCVDSTAGNAIWYETVKFILTPSPDLSGTADIIANFKAEDVTGTPTAYAWDDRIAPGTITLQQSDIITKTKINNYDVLSYDGNQAKASGSMNYLYGTLGSNMDWTTNGGASFFVTCRLQDVGTFQYILTLQQSTSNAIYTSILINADLISITHRNGGSAIFANSTVNYTTLPADNILCIFGKYTQSTNRFDIYIDGVQDGFVNNTLGLSTLTHWEFGSVDALGATGGEPFCGWLFEFGVYDRALSDAEILEISTQQLNHYKGLEPPTVDATIGQISNVNIDDPQTNQALLYSAGEWVNQALPTTGANVGGGAGELFRDKTADTLNFKTLTSTAVTAPLTIVTNVDTVDITHPHLIGEHTDSSYPISLETGQILRYIGTKWVNYNMPFGSLWFEDNAVSLSLPTQNVWVDLTTITTTFNTTSAKQVLSPSIGILRYTGIASSDIKLKAIMSAISSNNDELHEFRIMRSNSGGTDLGGLQPIQTANLHGQRYANFSVSADISGVNPTEQFKVQIRNINAGGRSITVKSLYFELNGI